VYHPEGKKIVIYFLAMENSEQGINVIAYSPDGKKFVTAPKRFFGDGAYLIKKE